MYHWLKYDSEKNQIYCAICRETGKKNNLSTGTNNFRVSTLTRHLGYRTVKKGSKSEVIEHECDHKDAVKEKRMAQNFEEMNEKIYTSKERAILVAFKVVYW